jgi:hypothetical protein
VPVAVLAAGAALDRHRRSQRGPPFFGDAAGLVAGLFPVGAGLGAAIGWGTASGAVAGLTGQLVSDALCGRTTSLRDALFAGISGAISGGLFGAVGWGVRSSRIRVFSHGGTEWHLGFEYGNKMNIIYVGNSSKYGVHIAFGSVAPKVANLHIYLQKAYPFFRVWKP